MLVYYAGLSYEKSGSFVHAGQEEVSEWYPKKRELFEGSTEKKRRKWIVLYEKEIKLNGTIVFIWGTVDLDDEKVIGVWISFGRSGLEAMIFLKKVKHAGKGKLPGVFIDSGIWYPWTLDRVGFKRHTVISLGPRSAIERFFGDIEKRIMPFRNGFIGKYTRESMERWVEAFVGFRNWKKDSKGALS